MADRMTVWECCSCECRGPTPATVQHMIICTDRTRARPMTFELGEGPAPSLF